MVSSDPAAGSDNAPKRRLYVVRTTTACHVPHLLVSTRAVNVGYNIHLVQACSSVKPAACCAISALGCTTTAAMPSLAGLAAGNTALPCMAHHPRLARPDLPACSGHFQTNTVERPCHRPYIQDSLGPAPAQTMCQSDLSQALSESRAQHHPMNAPMISESQVAEYCQTSGLSLLSHQHWQRQHRQATTTLVSWADSSCPYSR